MPNQNVRYPLVAIPKCFFNALRRDVAKDNDNPYAMASVNEYVQSFLNHSPMYDFLLRLKTVSARGDVRIRDKLIGDPELDCRDISFELKKVRVTESQFEMLHQRQAQYASDGLRIPISCIVSSMLWQWSKTIRSVFDVESSDRLIVSYQPVAWKFGDVKGSQVQLQFHEKDSDGHWLDYHYTNESGLTTPTVILGWSPRKAGAARHEPSSLRGIRRPKIDT